MIYNLFPTAVGHYKTKRNLTKAELKFINGQEKRENEGNKTSADHYILKNTELLNLSKFLEESLKDYLDQTLNPVEGNDIYITQSWINYTETGGYHHKHVHPNSVVSGVFYVDTDPERDRINFFKDSYNAIQIETKEWNEYNSQSWWYETVIGDLYLFPSRVAHSVYKISEGKTRVSLSFNTFVKGVIGSGDGLTELKL